VVVAVAFIGLLGWIILHPGSGWKFLKISQAENVVLVKI